MPKHADTQLAQSFIDFICAHNEDVSFSIYGRREIVGSGLKRLVVVGGAWLGLGCGWVIGAGEKDDNPLGVLEGKHLFNVANAADNEPFELEADVAKGETIDFAVGAGSAGYGCGNTPLDVTITQVSQ